MTPKNNAASWFEIPVSDMERAIKFYETVFEIKLERHTITAANLDMAWFPWVQNGTGASGSLNKGAGYKPSQDGALLYLTAHSGDLNNELGRVEAAGGKIILPKRQISEEHGYMALISDSEGNRIALHSKS